jgi:hypothetical protein
MRKQVHGFGFTVRRGVVKSRLRADAFGTFNSVSGVRA